jgi:chemotaxis signal transduction protein
VVASPGGVVRSGRAGGVEGDGLTERTLLVFRIASCWFAIDPELAQEIAAPQPAAPVPRVPAYIPGLMKLHSRAVPLLDLRRFLDLTPASEPSDEDELRRRVLVVSAGGMTVGLLCDRILSLLTVPATRILPPTSLRAGRVQEFAEAELADPDGTIGGRPGVIVVLSVRALLESARVRPAGGTP